MKIFILKYKRVIAFAVLVIAIMLICTTAGVSVYDRSSGELIDSINTCSVPQGKIMAHGVDVSRYQGDIDFNRVKSDGYDFVILRAGTSQGGKDKNFETYYKNARSAGLDIGCYYYTYAYTAQEVKQEVFTLLEYIKGKSFNYPVFLDFEFHELLSYDRTDENDAMIETFCKYVKRGGYYPGVYTSNSIYNRYIDKRTLGNKWDFWIASYRDNTHNYEGFKNSFSMWQYTSNGVVDGIDMRVDLNVSYVDYPEIISRFRQELDAYT